MLDCIYKETPRNENGDILDNAVIVTMFCGLISYTDTSHFEF
jgi:hypothetical protein